MENAKHNHKGPFSLKVVSWYDNPDAPLQLNFVCLNCNSNCYANHPYELVNWLNHSACPPRILEIEQPTGNVDIEALLRSIEKRST